MANEVDPIGEGLAGDDPKGDVLFCGADAPDNDELPNVVDPNCAEDVRNCL